MAAEAEQSWNLLGYEYGKPDVIKSDDWVLGLTPNGDVEDVGMQGTPLNAVAKLRVTVPRKKVCPVVDFINQATAST